MKTRLALISPRIAVMFAAFIMLGLPEGVLGTAWPSIRLDLDRPEAALAQLIIAYTVGYLVATSVIGRIVAGLGTDSTIRLGVAMTAVGLGLYAISPAWGFTLTGAVVLGSGAGVVDASVNAEVALRHGQRTMNLLHAAFGVGATLGPLFVTALLRIEASWRVAYVALAVVEVAILIALAGARDGEAANDEAESSSSYARLAKRPRLVLTSTLVYFAFYVGAEVSVGQWSYSILTEERGVSPTAAGIAVAAYWGGLTAGRLALGALGSRLHPMALLRGSGIVALVAVVWFAADVVGSLVALPILGFAFAGTFPALVLMTSSWLPEEDVTRAVGWQLAASSAGAIVASATLGAIADRQGLDGTVVGLVILVALLLAAHLFTEFAARAS